MGKNIPESKALGLCDQVDVHVADPPNEAATIPQEERAGNRSALARLTRRSIVVTERAKGQGPNANRHHR
jgi:hypothetical protein